MNAVSDSIPSPSLSATLDAAYAAYVADQQRQQAEIQAAEDARQAQLENEQAEARAWLATQIPSELVQYVDWQLYSHAEAEKTRLTGGYLDTAVAGALLWLQIPGAAPIAFSITRIWNGVDRQFSLVSAGGDDCMFWVPANGRMELDDDNEDYLKWQFPLLPNYRDFQVALGAAVRAWQESGETSQSQAGNLPELEKEPVEIYLTSEYPLSPLEQEYDEIGLMIAAWESGWRKVPGNTGSEVGKFCDLLAVANTELAEEFLELRQIEQEEIITACFLAGMAFGLAPHPFDKPESMIEAAVGPIERRNLRQWMQIEAQIRSAGFAERYIVLDRLIAFEKEAYQLNVLMHGAETGARIRNACLNN